METETLHFLVSKCGVNNLISEIKIFPFLLFKVPKTLHQRRLRRRGSQIASGREQPPAQRVPAGHPEQVSDPGWIHDSAAADSFVGVAN